MFLFCFCIILPKEPFPIGVILDGMLPIVPIELMEPIDPIGFMLLMPIAVPIADGLKNN